MGQRHLRGLLGEAASITLIDPLSQARDLCRDIAEGTMFSTLNDIDQLPRSNRFDLAILSGTALNRLNQFNRLVEYQIPYILVEKPLEQSRAKTRALIQAAQSIQSRVWTNHYRRNLEGFASVREIPGPLYITVSSGAMGLGANGIHWIDFAFHLTGQTSGKLLYGEIDEQPIGSGRGAQYRDYGGRGIFAFPDGSRLYLSSSASSSAPTMFSIVAQNEHWLVDQYTDRTLVHQRVEEACHPNYLYSKDYSTKPQDGLEDFDLEYQTHQFLRDLKSDVEPKLLSIEMVAPSYELLFDLLETSGDVKFQFT